MAFKVKSIGIVTAFILSYIIYVIILALLGLPNPVYKSSLNFISSDKDLKPIDTVIPDTISYRKYNALKDSTSIIRDLKNADYHPNEGINFSDLIATGSSVVCDTCSLSWFRNTYMQEKNDKPLKQLYYIQLPSWQINNKQKGDDWWTKDSVQFYVEHDQTYIRKYVTYSPKSNESTRSQYQMVDVPVKFRYNTRQQCVMIPVSESVKKAVNIIFGILGIVLIGYILILIGGFIGLLMDLSKGLMFTDRNLRTLKRITITLFAIPIAALIFNLLLRLIFSSYLTSDVVIKIDVLNGYWKVLMIGVIFLMIYRAFRQGKKLREEQEFTI